MPGGLWEIVFFALWAMLLANSAMLVLLGRHMRRLRGGRTVSADSVGLATGTLAPPAEATDLGGETRQLGGAAPRKRVLVFLSPTCSACRAAIAEMGLLSSEFAQVILIWQGSAREALELAAEHLVRHPMIADDGATLTKLFEVNAVPFAMVVSERGQILGKAFANSRAEVEALIAPGDGGDPADRHVAEPERAEPVHDAVSA